MFLYQNLENILSNKDAIAIVKKQGNPPRRFLRLIRKQKNADIFFSKYNILIPKSISSVRTKRN